MPTVIVAVLPNPVDHFGEHHVRLPGPDDTVLRSLAASDGQVLLSTIAGDRAAFDPWLRWSSNIESIDSSLTFIESACLAETHGTGFHLGLWRGSALLGGIPCWSIDPTHRVAELGYWLVPAARGQGFAARSVAVVSDYLFSEGAINRIEFQCRVENLPSRRVAESVGARLEGVRRQSHRIADCYRDHAVYAILAEEWRWKR
jgi:RimJ/RimL family protein N-acetyltransferase